MNLEKSQFKVGFSADTARVVNCNDSEGCISFTTDSGSRGDTSICLEHHPHDWPRDGRYTAAFEAAKEFLVSCGYEVEIFRK
jgi:hypothetical protein